MRGKQLFAIRRRQWSINSRNSIGKMTEKCHLNFIWTKWGLQLQLGQIRVQLGQIRVSPLFVQMKFKPNDKTALPLHKTKPSLPPFIKHILLLLFFLLGRDNQVSSSSCCLSSWSLEGEKGGNFGYYCDQDNILKHKLEAFLYSLHVRGRDEAILAKVKLVKEKKVGTLHIILIKMVFSL